MDMSETTSLIASLDTDCISSSNSHNPSPRYFYNFFGWSSQTRPTRCTNVGWRHSCLYL